MFDFLTPLETKMEDNDVEKIFLDAFKNRQDLQQANLQKKIRKLNLDIARMNQMPLLDLDFELSYSGSATNSADVFDNTFTGNPDIRIGLNFEVPLDPQSFRTITERARIEYQKSKESLEQLVIDVRLELNSLLRRINYLGRRVRESQLALNIQTKNVREYRKDFEYGKIDLQSYISSIEQLRNRQVLYLQSIFDYESTRAELQIAQGIFLLNYDIKGMNVGDKVR